MRVKARRDRKTINKIEGDSLNQNSRPKLNRVKKISPNEDKKEDRKLLEKTQDNATVLSNGMKVVSLGLAHKLKVAVPDALFN